MFFCSAEGQEKPGKRGRKRKVICWDVTFSCTVF